MRYSILDERTVRAAELGDYIGWNLNGTLARDGSLLWGEIVHASPAQGADGQMSVTYARRTRQGYTVPDGQLISVSTPTGAHMVTVSRSREVSAEEFAALTV